MRAFAGAVALLLVVVVAGCGSDDGTPMTIDWDLSHSHAMRDVDWPDPSISSIEPRPIESLRIRFSDGRELTESGGIKKLALDRDGEQVTELGVHSENMTVQDAYRLALRWCEQWRLPTTKIDEWHAAGGSRFNIVAYDPQAKPAAGDPYVSLKVLKSFDDERPVSIALHFFWARQPELAASA